MTRPDRRVLTLLILPILTIGCADSDSDGYHEITAAVESLPTTAEVDDADQTGAAARTANDNSDATPDQTADSKPLDVPSESPNALVANVETSSEGAVSPTKPPASDPSSPSAAPEDSPGPSDPPAAPDSPPENKPKREIKLLIPTKNFKVEGPEEAVRVSFDDVDLLKVLNMDPVIPQAPELMPDWLKQLDGKRIRIRGFMIPPFSETDVRAFTLARDTQLCCFGRNPLPYDLIDVFLKEDAATEYIELRPFDVVGVFHIGDEIEPGYLYSIDDAVVIQ